MVMIWILYGLKWFISTRTLVVKCNPRDRHTQREISQFHRQELSASSNFSNFPEPEMMTVFPAFHSDWPGAKVCRASLLHIPTPTTTTTAFTAQLAPNASVFGSDRGWVLSEKRQKECDWDLDCVLRNGQDRSVLIDRLPPLHTLPAHYDGQLLPLRSKR